MSASMARAGGDGIDTRTADGPVVVLGKCWPSSRLTDVRISPHAVDDPVALRLALVATGAISPTSAGDLEVARIGTGFGLSGTTVRVSIDEEPTRRFVVKQDRASVIRREQLFYTRHAPALADGVPGYLGVVVDGDVGLLVLDDVAPARQLDVLASCDDATAERLVSLLATLHATTWAGTASIDPALPRWVLRAFTTEEWAARLDAARRRFPDVLDDEAIEIRSGLPGRVIQTLDRFAASPRCWIHADAHLDNVLMRPDGSVILLDWATSCIGPPLVDLAQLLAGGLVDDPAREARVAPLVGTYASTLARHGIELDVGHVVSALSDAVLPWVQGIVGWAAAPELPTGRARMVLHAELAIAVAWAR